MRQTHRRLSRSDLTHPALHRRLYPVARRLGKAAALKRRKETLLGGALIGLLLALIGFFIPATAEPVFYSIGVIAIACLAWGWFHCRTERLDFLKAAQCIEEENTELKQSLVTAVEANLSFSQSSGFFIRRVTNQALREGESSPWEQAGSAKLVRSRIEYLLSVSALVAVLGISYVSVQLAAPLSSVQSSPALVDSRITILPGNQEVERGSSLVVTARFEGGLPSAATLVIVDDSGVSRNRPMAQSLSDPVFATAIRRIDTPLRYHILYNEIESPQYRIDVYDLPDLVQANARLDYPDYTGWTDRTVEDTKRISAIEGTKLRYEFKLNKPVSQAILKSQDGETIELEASSLDRNRYALERELQESLRYELQLVDLQGRVNPFPPDIVIDVLPNRRPILRFTQPRGDQRLSPIQEVALKGEASDDFGILDWGFAVAIGTETPVAKSMKTITQEWTLSADLETELFLEDYRLEPKDVVSWYIWADDYDSRGVPRRSTSDLYFADIRSLDELYREQDSGGAGQQGAANQGEDLVKQQRRISISLFRVKSNETDPVDAIEAMETIQHSQYEAQSQLRQLMPMLMDPSAREAGIRAASYMEEVMLELDTALDTPSLSPLDGAWIESQGAYQALLELSADEYSISRSQNQSGGGNSPNRAQLDELEFQQEENRYESATEAQPFTSLEEQQNLELLSKLNELSRRQQDVNERLQELQNALAEARTEEERQRIRRELKRLEEEQREMVASADEAIQQTGNRSSSKEARRQIEQTRDTMQEASEQLSRGEVSEALASGARAKNELDSTREQLRNQTASEFAEAMRNNRSEARRLASEQKEIEQQLDELANGSRRSLDDSEERDALAEKMEAQGERLSQLMDDLREITEGAQHGEPGLHRKLYDLLRKQSGSNFDERYDYGSDMLRQGFVDDAREMQDGLSEELNELSKGIAKAAETILGDETTTLRYSQRELDRLSEQLAEERGKSDRPGHQLGQQSGQTAQGQPGQSSPNQRGGDQSGSGQSRARALDLDSLIRDAISNFESGGDPQGPLTGHGYSEWIESLQTVESLIDLPEARERLSQAREAAESLRREFKRHSSLPQWKTIEDDIVVPLNDVRAWVTEELNRRVNADTLQAIDRDPVPSKYAEAVKRYYESLGEGSSEDASP